MGTEEGKYSIDDLCKKLLELPRLARIGFLAIYCDRASSLYFVKGHKLILDSLMPFRNAVKIVKSLSEVISRYPHNPYLYTRKDLEIIKEDAGYLEAIAFGANFLTDGMDVARALELFMECCIDDLKIREGKKTATESEPYLECFRKVHMAIVIGCDGQCLGTLEARISLELESFLDAMRRYNWNDESPANGTGVWYGWGDSKPAGWPASSSVGFWGNFAIGHLTSLPIDAIKMIFKK